VKLEDELAAHRRRLRDRLRSLRRSVTQ
jgi:hypothetical protein